MWDLAVREDDYRGIEAMLLRYRGRPPLSFRLLPALARNDSAARRALLEEARTLESRQLQIAARYTASYLEDFRTADSLARLDLGWRERAANRANAQILIASLAAARGRWTSAREGFRVAETMDGAGPVGIYRALTATVPLFPVPPADLRAIREELERWGPGLRIEGGGLAAPLQPYLRPYLLGLISNRLGDHAAAERSLAELRKASPEADIAGVVQSLAATLRADLAWARHRPAEVLESLSSSWRPVPLELVALSRAAHFRIYGLEHARLLRALALAELGRDVEALGWLRHGFRQSPQEFLYLGPIHHSIAGVFERLGQPDSAAAHHRKFLELWGEADSAAVPILQEAQARLIRLTSKGHP